MPESLPSSDEVLRLQGCASRRTSASQMKWKCCIGLISASPAMISPRWSARPALARARCSASSVCSTFPLRRIVLFGDQHATWTTRGAPRSVAARSASCPFHHLISAFTALENVLMPLIVAKDGRLPRIPILPAACWRSRHERVRQSPTSELSVANSNGLPGACARHPAGAAAHGSANRRPGSASRARKCSHCFEAR